MPARKHAVDVRVEVPSNQHARRIRACWGVPKSMGAVAAPEFGDLVHAALAEVVVDTVELVVPQHAEVGHHLRPPLP